MHFILMKIKNQWECIVENDVLKKKKKLVHQSKWIVKWQGDPRQFKKTSEQLPAE